MQAVVSVCVSNEANNILARRRKMKKQFIGFIAILLVLGGCGSPKENEDSNTKDETSVSESTVSAEPATVQEEIQTNTNEQDSVTQYVNNQVINDFINSYNNSIESPLENIDNSSRRYRCTAETKGYYIVMEDLEEDFRINIDQTNDTASLGTAGMKDIFADFATVLSGTVSREEAYTYFDEAMSVGRANPDGLGNLDITIYRDTDISRGHIQMQKKK